MSKLDKVITYKTLSGVEISTTYWDYVEYLRQKYLSFLKNLEENKRYV